MTSRDVASNVFRDDVRGERGDSKDGWQRALHAAFSSAFTAGVVTGGIFLVGALIEEVRDAAQKHREERIADQEETSTEPDIESDDDPEVQDAALLLGVEPHASEREIRSALRARFKETSLHPDHGGDAELARDLIAAKNLLIEHVRAVHP